jgi:lipooligosaccharide transport system ATP-binding protein
MFPDNQNEYIINAAGLNKSYGDFLAVDAIDLKIRAGECFGFLGPNGAGKTTTMRMLYLASPMSSGQLEILGKDISNKKNHHDVKRNLEEKICKKLQLNLGLNIAVNTWLW